MTSGGAETNVAAAVRATPEYRAAFDIELWKAEQMRCHREAMAKEASALHSRLQAEYAERDAARVAEMEKFRAELEAMAERVKASGLAVERRAAAVEQREAAFEARRLAIARRHEEHLLEAEAKGRRAAEQAQLRIDALQSQLGEKERAFAHSQHQLGTVQRDFEVLQRAMTRQQGEEGGTKAALHRADAKLLELSRLLEQSRDELTAKERLVAEASERASELAAACTHYKQHLVAVTDRYNRLAAAYNAEMNRRFQVEREKLVCDERRLVLQRAKHRGANAACGEDDEDGPAAYELVAEEFFNLQRGHVGGGALGKERNGGNSEIALLRQCVEKLADEARREAEAERRKAIAAERARRRQDQHRRAQRRRQRRRNGESDDDDSEQWGFVAIEGSPAAAAAAGGGARTENGGSAGPHDAQPVTVVALDDAEQPFVRLQPPPTPPPSRHEEQHDRRRRGQPAPEESSASSAGQLRSDKAPKRQSGRLTTTVDVSVSSSSASATSDLSPPASGDDDLPPTSQHHPHHRHAARASHDDRRTAQDRPADRSAGHQHSSRSGVFGHGDARHQAVLQRALGSDLPVIAPAFADIDPWVDVFSGHGHGLGAGSGVVSESFRATPVSSESPRALDQHHPELDDAFSLDGAAHAPLPPAPAPTAVAAAAPPPHGGDHPLRPRPQAGAAAQNVEHREVLEFVERLRVNRQRLLDTGVYSANDPLILEMSGKIAAYTDYVATHSSS